MKSKKMTAGFTLVELIVVIAILGILAGVGTVGYSGYIKKANAAADQQLLSHLNTAFAAACAANGESHYGRSDTTIALAGDEGAKEATVSVSGITDFSASFGSFFEGGTFKTITALLYSPKTGGFVETTTQMASLADKIRAEFADELKALEGTNLAAFGAETLLTEVGSAVEWANNFGLAELAGDPFYTAYYSYLGVDLSKYDLDNPEQAEKADAELVAAVQKLGGNEDRIVANSVALYAAQNTAGITTADISNWLKGDSTTDSFKTNANATTLAEAAAIYGLYMSYQGDDFNNKNGNALEVMVDALSDSTFSTWVTTDEGKAELEAYKASMSLINGASKDEETRNSILTNGFDDPDLIKVIESLMGN